MIHEIDFSRPPTEKEVAKFERRLQRISLPGYADQVLGAFDQLRLDSPVSSSFAADGLRVRPEFCYDSTGADVDASDRRAPNRSARPPATRISSSRGSALRLMLVALALVQLHRRPGDKANIQGFDLEVQGRLRKAGWTDLLAVPSDRSTGGRTFVSASDKRARVVRSALETLSNAGLVALPNSAPKRDRHAGFALLHEGGSDSVSTQAEYMVPSRAEHTLALPSGLITNGWVHVMEDSELTLLLMIACGRGGWSDDGYSVIPADVRLQKYGIHRDPYSSARKTLEWFRLLDVREVGRHEDGRAENDERLVHRMRIIESGFDEQPMSVVPEVLRSQIARR